MISSCTPDAAAELGAAARWSVGAINRVMTAGNPGRSRIPGAYVPVALLPRLRFSFLTNPVRLGDS